MKKIIATLIVLSAINSNANTVSLSCQGYADSQRAHFRINGNLAEGSVLKLESSPTGNFSSNVSEAIEIKVSKIEDSKSFYKIIGTAANLVFIGGGSSNYVLMLPKVPTTAAYLNIATHTLYNQTSEAYEMTCTGTTDTGMVLNLGSVKPDDENTQWFNQIQTTEDEENPMWFNRIERNTSDENPAWFNQIDQVN